MKVVLIEQGFIDFKKNQKTLLYKIRNKFKTSNTQVYFSNIGCCKFVDNGQNVLIERFKPLKELQELVTLVQYDEICKALPLQLNFNFKLEEKK